MRKSPIYLCIALCTLLTLLLSASACSESVTLCFSGDVLLDRGVLKQIDAHGFDYPYTAVQNVLRSADISFGNLECPLTNSGIPALKRPDLVFKADPQNSAALQKAGYDVLNLANNHTMDQGALGLGDTISALLLRGIRPLGAGFGRNDARSLVLIKAKGLIVGFLGYSDFPPEGFVLADNDYMISGVDEKAMPAEIAAARKKCDLLVVSLHFGKEFAHYPSVTQKRIARLCANSGADLIVGHHPHVLQGMERYNGKLIVYSLGNFVFDKQIPSGTDEAMLLQVHADKRGISQVDLLPVVIKACRPSLAKGKEKKAILERFEEYSAGIRP